MCKGEIAFKDLKMLALDLDGTLLRKDKTIGDLTRQTLHNLRGQGVEITLVTGRVYHFSKHVEDLLGFPVNFICTDGAFLRPVNWRQPVFETINPQVTKMVLKTLKAHLGSVYLVSNDQLLSYTADPDPEIRSWGFIINKHDFTTENEARIKQVEQIIIIDQAAKTRGIYKALNTVLPGVELDMSPSLKSGYNQLVIRPQGVNKGSGLRTLTEILGIDIAETVAFGDWLNDLSMFNEAGLAIAPANAVPKVKEKAGIVSAFSNDQDFIAIELQRLLTERKIIA
ncbi:MAG TPA: hypothetical protein DDZ91_14555 [Firmicutes bacterium]|nr:hypothetical protein [Bacillota bacterium]